jgi:hypothetical protein
MVRLFQQRKVKVSVFSTPIGKPKIFYSNELVKKDLGVNFNPAMLPLNGYSM